MTDAPSPDPASAPAMAVVRRFFACLEAKDVAAAADLLADDAEWVNVSLPTLRGRERVRTALGKWLDRPTSRFEVYIHKMAVDGGSVLVERTDVLIFARVRVQVWVWGRFDVEDGRILMWKDYFDWWAMLAATGRGLLGAVVPALGARPPVDR